MGVRKVVAHHILVIGGTGTVGGQVLSQLPATGVRVRALARNPGAARVPSHVEVVGGDLTRPETLDACLRGIDVVFLVWTAPPAAVAPAFERITRHARPLGWWAPQVRAGDVVRWPHLAAPTAPIHERDIAAVAVRALCEDGHVGAEYVLTGPESLSQREQLATIGRAIGRSLQIEDISPDEARRELQMPPVVVNMLLDAWAAALGQPAFVTSTVAEITGKPARTFLEWATDNAVAFRPASARGGAARELGEPSLQ